MPDIANEHQAATRKCQVAAIWSRVATVAIERACHRPATLIERCNQIAPHQAEPVRVGGNLVLGIDRRNGIFKVDDGRQRGFQNNIGDARRICLANRVTGIKNYFYM